MSDKAMLHESETFFTRKALSRKLIQHNRKRTITTLTEMEKVRHKFDFWTNLEEWYLYLPLLRVI